MRFRLPFCARNERGYTILEVMVVVSIIGVIFGMLYLYNNRGWKLFNKSIDFGRLQLDARAALEQMSYNIKQTSPDLIYTNRGFNARVPLPPDYLQGKPYIYFAAPSKQSATKYKERDLKSKEKSSITLPPYDYYLYYIANAVGRDGEFIYDRARLKLLKFLAQDGPYTISNAIRWPVLPPAVLKNYDIDTIEDAVRTGQVNDIDMQDVSPEFSTYQSEFSYNYFNSNYENVFSIQVKMIDKETDTKVEFSTAVAPRG